MCMSVCMYVCTYIYIHIHVQIPLLVHFQPFLWKFCNFGIWRGPQTRGFIGLLKGDIVEHPSLKGFEFRVEGWFVVK